MVLGFGCLDNGLSSIEPKLIFCCSHWGTWFVISRVIACFLGFGSILYLWALKCFVVALHNTGRLLVTYTCLLAYLLDRDLSSWQMCGRNPRWPYRSWWVLRLMTSSILVCQPHKLESYERHNWVNPLWFLRQVRLLNMFEVAYFGNVI